MLAIRKNKEPRLTDGEGKISRSDAYQRRWRRKNKHRTNPLLRAFRAANKELLNAKRRDYRRRNLKKVRAADRKYYRANFERKRVEHDAAVARRKLAEGKYTLKEWRRLLQTWRYKCAYCGCQLTRKTATADHLTPLSRGGTNWIRNILPACLPCNQRKNFLTKAEYLRRLKKTPEF